MASVSFGVFNKKRNSTKQPTSFTDQRTVNLKESCSQDKPIFVCTGNNFHYNYCIWDGKYYFIDDIISLRNNEIEIHCILDVLATYKSYITGSTQFVSYSSHKTSDWLADTRIPLLQQTQVSSDSSLTGILSTIGTYVLTVVGENGCSIYASPHNGDIASILTDISTWETDGIVDAINEIQTQTPTPPSSTAVHATSQDNMNCFNALIDTVTGLVSDMTQMAADVQDSMNVVLESVEKAAVHEGFIGNSYANAPSCIRSCIWVPFDFALSPTGSGSGTVHLGTYNTGVSMSPTNGTSVSGSTSVDIPWHYNDWRRSICEDVYLYLPLVGMVQLSGDSLTHAASITIDWSVTYTDGVIAYKVSAGGEVIGAYGGQCAANFPIGIAQQASAGEVMNALIGGVEKVVSSLINSSISPISAAGSIAGVAGSAITGYYEVQNVKKSTHISCVGGVGGGAGIGLGRDCICYTVCHPTVVNPSDMVDTMGYPTMKPYTLASLTGYCQCANAHVAAPATASELSQIDAYLNSGFYIE